MTPHIGVFFEGQKSGYELDYLRQINLDDVTKITRLSSTESASVYGGEWQWGAIVISRR